ncbi:MAG: PRC-barrel domain-containing protein [Gallionella sp.]|nr:PRC-barrel domain-containing protein [Gallionella sp.]MDD4959362.1 PRC-barrel domain-containing protein [Gallionella sp.]
MLRTMNDLEDYAIHATDGNIGRIKDFYFDDEAWVIRYLIVDTGTWLLSRKVLISPIAFGQPNWAEKILPVSITQEQVKNSPDIDTAKPVSRQHEMQYLDYYGYPPYWGGGNFWGGGAYPYMMLPDYGTLVATPQPDRPESMEAFARDEAAGHQNDDLHLRSCKVVEGYHIEAVDGDIGHLQGMLVDEETWAIRYLIVNTSNWWIGHQVLISPQWIRDVNWLEAKISVNLTQQSVQDAPPYHSAEQLNREQALLLIRQQLLKE